MALKLKKVKDTCGKEHDEVIMIYPPSQCEISVSDNGMITIITRPLIYLNMAAIESGYSSMSIFLPKENGIIPNMFLYSTDILHATEAFTNLDNYMKTELSNIIGLENVEIYAFKEMQLNK
ncbi:hypothetical protein CCP3SC1AL1_310013 [Gammaproteobacteria bacterium]